MKFNIYNIECIRTLLQYYRIVLIQINMCCIPNDSPPHNIYTDYILYGRITSITLHHGASRVCVQSRTYRPIHVTCAPNTYKDLPTHVSDVSSRSYPSTTPIPTISTPNFTKSSFSVLQKHISTTRTIQLITPFWSFPRSR